MPTATFFNLREDKQETIVQAALLEFSQRSLPEALVSNIVKESDIARGSFYKYFEDMEDLYLYVYSLMSKRAHLDVIQAIQEADGHLFNGLERYMEQVIHLYENPVYYHYFKTVTLNLNYTLEQHLLDYRQQNARENTMASFIDKIDLSSLDIHSVEELRSFFKVLTPVIHQCMSDYFAHSWDNETLKKEYQRRINWLKKGVEISEQKEGLS
ncbi:TetR/AcrR family transcriptional regulator [Vagococcus sp.]|uniref:TetR/AcrR family transcriptional regulator n=1 Tax=Vagococcus sp. TaxID=1933889 RepID=UPI000EC1EE70|nr:TetR/AcrR family transcriptional regulator [Vagococcus sp.]HCT96668.1 hypothetical protein [Vagococcus sp.]